MRHKPEDLHIVEWHYLVLYFGTEEFQKLSNMNSQNRSLAQTKHMMGSKPFAQCSYELRDPQTGEEPNDVDLWVKTHSKGGKWTNDASKAVYESACSKIAEKEKESPNSFIPLVERNLIFQEAYKQTTRAKSSKVHGNGYLARYPSRRQLMTERFEDQACSEMASHMENEELKATLETRTTSKPSI